MPTLSFKPGLAISGLAGSLLSILSISMQSIPECGWLGGPPFCGRLIGGAPIGYFPFEGIYDLPELTFSVFLFALNTLSWILPFFFTFSLVAFALRKQFLQSKRAIGMLELLLLAPVLLWLVAYLIEAAGIILPFDLAFHALLLSDYVGKFLLPSSPVVEAVDISSSFAILFYICWLAFGLSIILMSFYKRDGRVLFRYPMVAGLILLTPALMSWASGIINSGELQQQDYPFQILQLSLSKGAETDLNRALALDYQLRFFELPKEGEIFAVYYYVYSDLQEGDQYQVGRGTHVDYLKQQNGIIYHMAPGTLLRDNEFVVVVQDVVSGTIPIEADGQPKYLYVWIFEADGKGPRRLFDYFVSIGP